MTTQCVQVKIEMGHKASIRAKPTPEGFTHDWTVFVRGPEGSNIQHFVEKVVFVLHESFPKPKRVIREPPYQISESGYAGFNLPIHVHFKHKEEPKKVQYEYDLYLQLEGTPISHARTEKLTFNNPTEDFRRKLIKAGGVGVLGLEGGTLLNHHQKLSPHSSNSSPGFSQGSSSLQQQKPLKQISEAIKAPKSSSSSSSSSHVLTCTSKSSGAGTTAVTTTSTSVPLVPSTTSFGSSSAAIPTKEVSKNVAHLQPPKSFVDLFGQPIKTSKALDSSKGKDKHSKLISGKLSKPSSKTTSVSSGISSEDAIPAPIQKESKVHQSLKSKDEGKRPSSSPQSTVTKKHKRSVITPPSNVTSKTKDEKEKRKTEDKTSFSQDKARKHIKAKHSTESADVKASAHKRLSEGKIKKEQDRSKDQKKERSPPRPLPSSSSSPSNSSESSEVRSTSKTSPAPFQDGGDASPSSSISFSSLPHGGRGSGPLGALMAELDEDDDDILSPLSSDTESSSPSQKLVLPLDVQHEREPLSTLENRPPSPLPPTPLVEKVKPPSKIKEEKRKKASVDKGKTEKRLATETGGKKKSAKNKANIPAATEADNVALIDPSSCNSLVSSVTEQTAAGYTEEYIEELRELQRRIMMIRDRGHLQQIVNVIEETGLYQVTSTTFDFDLCTLDRVTVKKLQSCLSANA